MSQIPKIMLVLWENVKLCDFVSNGSNSCTQTYQSHYATLGEMCHHQTGTITILIKTVHKSMLY